jgi:hypothetical protein
MSIVYRSAKGSRLTSDEVDGNFQYLESLIGGQGNAIITENGFSLVGQDITFNASWVWNILNVEYSNPADVEINIPLAATGNQRIDLIVVNTLNTFERIAGTESNSNPIAPSVPLNKIVVSFITVTDGVVNEPTDPILGATFVKKTFARYYNSTITGINALIPFHLEGNSEVRLTSPTLTSVAGFDFSDITGVNGAESPHSGKAFTIRNLTGNDVVFKHQEVSSPFVSFYFNDEQDLVVPAGQTISFHFNRYEMREVFKGWHGVDLSQKADLVDGKVPAYQLPSYVDDVLEVASFSALPIIGETSKIYVTLDTNKQYRWSGTTYIEISGPALLEGTQYTYVYGNGTPTENATELQNAYTAAKAISGLSVTNRFKIIVGTGKYELSGQFDIDTQYIDIVSLTGDADVEFTNGINVTANDVFLKGLKTTLPFELATNLNLLVCENCKGGDLSFGSGFGSELSGTFTNCVGGDGSFSLFGNCSGIFTNCIGGVLSFSGMAGNASGVFINCVGGDGSFGANEIASGTFTNCVGGYSSFGSGGAASGTFTNCVGREDSFGGGSSITGKLFYCRLTSGTFISVSSGGRTYYCVDGNGNPNNQ